MIIHKDIDQGGDAWDDLRAPLATASEFGKIFTGGEKISTQREAYMRQCAVSRKYKLPSWEGNEHTERGHKLEPVARDLFRKETSLDVREIAFIEHDNGLCGMSPDSVIFAPDDRMIGGLEIKCFAYDKHIGIVTKGILPTANKPQVHGSLFIAKVPCWQFMVFHPDAHPCIHKVIETEPDNYTDNLENEVLKFCEELDQMAEEYIADYDKILAGSSMISAMPILQRQLTTQSPADDGGIF